MNSQDLMNEVAKFLNFQVFNKNSSKLTSKSYANDLNQFLTPLKAGRIIFKGSKYVFLTDGVPLNGKSSPKKALLKASKAENFDLKTKSEGLKPPVKDRKVNFPDLIRQAQMEWAPLSPASRNRKYATLKSFFRWTREEGLLEENFGELLTAPKVPQRIPHFISIDEAMSLLKSLGGEQKPTARARSSSKVQANYSRDRALILLLYGGGLRVSEACGLKWEQVDLRSRSLTVYGKGGKERKVVLVDLATKALQRMERKGPYIFGEKPLDTRTAYEIVRQAGAKAGLLKPLHPHALRHSYATHLLSGGTDLRILQELLGHESLTATQKYLHLSLDSLARTMESHHPLGERAEDDGKSRSGKARLRERKK